MKDIKTSILFSALFNYNGNENKDIIKVAIKNSDIDIEKLCESLNL